MLLKAVMMGTCPEVMHELQEITRTYGLDRLGKLGTNIYYCDAYLAALHCDRDKSWSICCQLELNAGFHEYGFAFAEWGVYIVTQERAVW